MSLSKGDYFDKGFKEHTKTLDYQKAIEYYNKALELDPKYHTAWYNRGLCFNNLKKFDEAIESFKSCVK